MFYATYLNAALVTLSVMALFTVLYAYLNAAALLPTTLGWVFIPVYGALNLVVYLSQITVIPALFDMRANPATAPVADILLRLVLQSWPGSAMAFFNALAYALLGIPSILFGLVLRQRGYVLRWGGVLLALSGIASILGLIGVALSSSLPGGGITLGGVLFLFALFPLSWGLLWQTKN